jgi:hypothetical protein
MELTHQTKRKSMLKESQCYKRLCVSRETIDKA